MRAPLLIALCTVITACGQAAKQDSDVTPAAMASSLDDTDPLCKDVVLGSPCSAWSKCTTQQGDRCASRHFVVCLGGTWQALEAGQCGTEEQR